MSEALDEPQNPGSLVDFAERTDMSPAGARRHYDEALTQYRQELAEYRGVSLDELHGGIGQIGAVATTVVTGPIVEIH